MTTRKSDILTRMWLTPLILWMAIVAICLVGCNGKDTIHIGFVAQLTGVQAELGIQERNGVQLAVEAINTSEGIDGRRIELVVRDDLGTPEGAQAADRELIEYGVVAIIGHATSEQTMAGLAVTNPARIVMLSPSATTPELSGRDDFFFRVAYSLVDRAKAMARHMYQDQKVTRVAVICDTDNSAYSKAFLKAFAVNFKVLGGKLAAEVEFSSVAQPDFVPLVANLRAGNPEGLLIIAADMDTALIAQRTRLMGWPIRLFTTAWAQTETLINNGGQAVEGLEIEIANTYKNQTPDYLDFKTRYQARFGQTPSFGAALGYEAARFLADALKITGGRADGLTRALTGIKNFKGLTDNFSMDRFGDAIRPFYMGTIHNGKYVDINTLASTQPRD